jgi:L-serine dehydratase
MISVFDVIGPAMVGPSSSHTAGACRIGLIAHRLFASPPVRAEIGLHGSFAATGSGHATDRAIVAGLLGLATDDPRLKDSHALAASQGLQFTISHVDLGEDAHPNSARIVAETAGGESHTIEAASTGGGMIDVRLVDGYATSFGGQSETLLLWHADKSGFLAKVTTLLACAEANIATIRTSRHGRGADAFSVIEVDQPLPEDCLSVMARMSAVRALRHFSRLP